VAAIALSPHSHLIENWAEWIPFQNRARAKTTGWSPEQQGHADTIRHTRKTSIGRTCWSPLRAPQGSDRHHEHVGTLARRYHIPEEVPPSALPASGTGRFHGHVLLPPRPCRCSRRSSRPDAGIPLRLGQFCRAARSSAGCRPIGCSGWASSTVPLDDTIDGQQWDRCGTAAIFPPGWAGGIARKARRKHGPDSPVPEPGCIQPSSSGCGPCRHHTGISSIEGPIQRWPSLEHP